MQLFRPFTAMFRQTAQPAAIHQQSRAAAHPLLEPLMNAVPMVIDASARGERAMDIYSLLLRERIVFIGTEIDDRTSNLAVAQLLYLAREEPERDIYMYINSPGGIIYPGLSIYDTMQLIKPDVATICLGFAMSMATILLAGGKKGKRYAMPNSTVMIHQPLGGSRGQAVELEIEAREAIRLRTLLNGLLQQHTGQSLERIERDTDRNFYMSAEQAKDYGLVDEILTLTTPEAAAEENGRQR